MSVKRCERGERREWMCGGKNHANEIKLCSIDRGTLHSREHGTSSVYFM